MLRAISTVKRFYAPDNIDNTERMEDRIYWEAKMPTIGARRRALDLVAGAGGSWLTTSTIMAHAMFSDTNIGYYRLQHDSGGETVYFGRVGEIIPDNGAALVNIFSDPTNIDKFLADFDMLPEYISDWVIDVCTSALTLWEESDVNFTKKPKNK